jgi:hypothetical protein
MSAYPTDADPPGVDFDETGPYDAGDAGPDGGGPDDAGPDDAGPAYGEATAQDPAGEAGIGVEEYEEYEAGEAGPQDEYVGATYGSGEPPAADAPGASVPTAIAEVVGIGAYEPAAEDVWPAEAGEAGDTAWEDGGAGEPVVPEVARVAAAVAVMDDVVRLPVSEHVARYEALHGELSDALASIDGV